MAELTNLRQCGIVQFDGFTVAADGNAAAVDFNLGQVATALDHLIVSLVLGNSQGNHQHDHAGADHNTHQRQRGTALAA